MKTLSASGRADTLPVIDFTVESSSDSAQGATTLDADPLTCVPASLEDIVDEWLEPETNEAHSRLTPEPSALPPSAGGIGTENAIEPEFAPEGGAPGALPEREMPDVEHYAKKRKNMLPRQRAVCIALAQGYSFAEVAEQFNRRAENLRNFARIPWVRDYISELQEKYGCAVVRKRLAEVAIEAAQVQIDIMRGTIPARDPAAARGKAAKEILDRLYPVTQVVEHRDVDPNELTDAELAARIQQRMN